ncbi:MAG: hypothetical protein Alpg2KO_09310 [Alphaproteobacteria bacterium]
MSLWQNAMRQAIRDVHRSYWNDPDHAGEEVLAKIESAMAHVYGVMSLQHKRSQALVDNGGDYEMIDLVCDGAAKYLNYQR